MIHIFRVVDIIMQVYLFYNHSVLLR